MPAEIESNKKYFDQAIKEAKDLLDSKREWVERYKRYSERIIRNTKNIRNKKNQFNQWTPLYLYMNVGSAQKAANNATFNLRYRGQNVADLEVGGTITIKTKKYDNENERDFGCKIKLNNEWKSKEATEFRKHFKKYPLRSKTKENKGNEEHRIESMFLTELSETAGKLKHDKLHWIQPVKMASTARFQMPTPFSASRKLAYAGKNGGGIDILARVGNGPHTNLCVMEVKDEYSSNEPPQKALAQGLKYATFIRELLRSTSGEDWWKIFGFTGKMPKNLSIHVACVMPFDKNGESEKIAYDSLHLENDTFKLEYIYFKEENNIIKSIETSFS